MMANKVVAIVLAAGLSSRMKQFKPLLPLGGVSALERVVRTFREAGVTDVRVVIGHRHEELEPVIESLGVRPVLNRRHREGMISSVTAGINTIDPEADAFFVQPVDVSLVRAATIRRLLQVYRQSRADLLYPCFLGRRGHPPLIAGRHAKAIASWGGAGGLRAVLARWEQTALEVAVADDLILCDMDTPDAYQSLAARAERLGIPSQAECRALLTLLGVEEQIIRHGREVARVAAELGERLNRAGFHLDLPLLAAAGLLHDLARHKPDHALAGARLLRELDFGAVADLVASHMDIVFSFQEPINAAAVLFLADKLVNGDQSVSLTERFRVALERYADQPEIIRKVRDRLATAQNIQQRLESLLGHPLVEMLKPVAPAIIKHAS